ncbi:MAG TPA: XRE family transcriptional regulator, partial [Flavobacteriaceae bacterium]|nr:XRE family transcriptional regulator [Flavobacteriaceae bacterium]
KDDTIRQLAHYFNVSTDYLLNGVESSNSNITTPKVDTIAAHIDDNVTDQQMDEILNFIEFVKNRDHKK